MLKAPKFWFSNGKYSLLISKIMAPLAMIWEVCARLRLMTGRYESFDVPIVCIGNITIGGSGKTPTSIALAELCIQHGINAHIISKGYKGKCKGPKKVTSKDSAYEIGDEPLLMSNFATVWVAKKRTHAITSAINDGAELIILDDGFQDSSIRKNISIITVDAQQAFGNKKVLPAGPLREKLHRGFKRADILLVIGSEYQREKFLNSNKLPKNLMIMSGEITIVETGLNIENTEFIAAAGIAHPRKFFDILRLNGAKLIKEISLPDHVVFSRTLIERLKKLATKNNVSLIVTEKDYVKIPTCEKSNFVCLPIKLNFLQSKELITLIKNTFDQSVK